MDGQRFDELTRALASEKTRRAAVKGLATGALGGFLALFHRSGVSGADKVLICHNTDDPSNPVVLIEVSTNAIPAHEAHGDVIGVDLDSDPNNCGACGNVCPGDACNTAVCNDGVCGNEPVVCGDDGNVCTTEFCDPASGCVSEFNTEPCTTAEGDEGTCFEGVCEPNPDPGCAGATCATFIECDVNPDCVCATIITGGGICTPGSTLCADLSPCPGGQADCGADEVCVVDTCCGEPVCVPLALSDVCSSTAFTSAAESSSGGPTLGGK